MLALLPNITILIPTLNESEFIRDCIGSILSGNYPSDRLEILVIDGGSTDQTQEIITELAQENKQVSLLKNPNKTVPAAMNIGIAEARHEILAWLGAHAIYDPNYLVKSVRTLQAEQCASVGGVITPCAKTLMGKAIAAATTSKFGIGNAKYRYADTMQAVDTVFGGCWWKNDIELIGGFDERWARNQDFELNIRLRQKVGKVILNPEIKCQYFCRETLHELAEQYWNYGYWRFLTTMKHPASFSIRQAAPLFLSVGFCVSIFAGIYGYSFWWTLPLSYFIATLLAGLQVIVKWGNLPYYFFLPIIFTILHLSWGFGFLYSLSKQLINRLKRGLIKTQT